MKLLSNLILSLVLMSNTLISTPTPPKITEIKISAIGDCTIGFDSTKIDKKVSYISKGNDLSYYFKNVVEILSSDDLTIANCETTFTKSNIKRKKSDNPAFHFKGPPAYAEVLKLGSIETVNLANNHINDYGNLGFSDTKKNLDQFQIQHFGETEVSYFTKDDITIALLGFNVLCKNYKSESAKIKKVLNEVSKISNLQVVSLHWGKEKQKKPTKDQIWLGHFLIDNGADLILGHHPHVIEPIEIYKGKTIVYSLANFSYGGHLKPQPETFIYQQTFKFTDTKLTGNDWSVIPCLMYSGNINNYQPILAEGKKAEEIKNFLLNTVVK